MIMKNKMKQENHIMTTDLDLAQYCDFKFTVDAESLLMDIKFLLKTYYCGTFEEDEKALKLSFNNGQKFLLKLEEAV